MKYINDKVFGKATLYLNKNERIEFKYVNNRANGEATHYLPNGDYINFIYKNGIKEGNATEFKSNGDKIEFYFIGGTREGEAIEYLANKDKIEFQYKNDKREGKAIEKKFNGDKIEFQYENNKRKGKGIYYFSNGTQKNILYENDKEIQDDVFTKNGNLNYYKPKNNMFRLNKNQNKKPKILIYNPDNCITFDKKEEKRNSIITKHYLTRNQSLVIKTCSYEKNEQYFDKKKDLNNINYFNNDIEEYIINLDLFLSLKNVENIKNTYSIKLHICNNIKFNQYTYLEETETKSGKEIIYGTNFEINYFFQKEQLLSGDLVENSELVISQFNIKLAEIMHSKDLSKKINLYNIDNNEKICELEFNAKKRGKDETIYFSFFKIALTLFSNSQNQEYFYVIKTLNDEKNWRDIYKSYEANITDNKEFIFHSVKTESNIKNMNFKFEVYKVISYDLKNIKGEFLGSCLSTSKDLLDNFNKNQITFLDIKSDENKKIGELKINFNMVKKLEFLDYLKADKQINLEIAIDYTTSNGDPNDINSYHYINGRTPNDYEKVILDCCSIVSDYDADQLFPVFGFGGIPPNNRGKVSHIFNINFKEEPEIDGFDQIIPTYKNSLKQIKLSNPCYFAPLLKSVYNRIKENENNPEYIDHYFILMILTNGIINDLQETIDILIDCSYIPLSVIIIGIGNGDFANMVKLDGDEELLVSSKGETRKRDLVQFVEYNKFKGDIIEGKMELKDEVLKEIPRQVEEYYELMENKIFEKNNEKNNIQINSEIDPKASNYLNFTKIGFFNNQNQNQNKKENKIMNLKKTGSNFRNVKNITNANLNLDNQNNQYNQYNLNKDKNQNNQNYQNNQNIQYNINVQKTQFDSSKNLIENTFD